MFLHVWNFVLTHYLHLIFKICLKKTLFCAVDCCLTLSFQLSSLIFPPYWVLYRVSVIKPRRRSNTTPEFVVYSSVCWKKRMQVGCSLRPHTWGLRILVPSCRWLGSCCGWPPCGLKPWHLGGSKVRRGQTDCSFFMHNLSWGRMVRIILNLFFTL